MKTCPRCNRTYPDSENFCADDSTQLVSSPAFTQQSDASRIECPVCGGKAEPGEIICNFCGARLDQGKGAPAPPPPSATIAKPANASPYPKLSSAPTSVQAPAQPPMTARMGTGGIEEVKEGGSGFSIIGYAIAAILALAAGAWFAIHLSSGKSEQAGVTPAPSSAASSPGAVSSPIVALANAMAVQVSGAGSSSRDRSAEVVRKAFDDNVASLTDTYNNVLATDPKVADGMLVRLRFRPDGTVADSAVRISTSPDPSLDAKVAAAMTNWKLPASSAGEVDADYPVIFAHDSGEEERLESALQSKVASLSPVETPEYASAPAPEASPAAAPGVAGASPGAEASPSVASAPEAPPGIAPAVPSEVAKPRHKKRTELAAIPPPAPSLFDQVQQRLKSSPKLKRVKAYTNGGTVTLFGKVFGEEEKSFAVETVRNMPGVTSVVDNITTDESIWAQQQSQISQQLANSGFDKVTVKVIGHDAFLSGEVKTDLEKTRAVTVAEQAAPVTVRENLIRVVPGNMFGF